MATKNNWDQQIKADATNGALEKMHDRLTWKAEPEVSLKAALDRDTFGLALKIHRKRLGLTQSEAANMLRISLRTWINWEKNEGGDPTYPAMRGALEILKFAKKKS